MNNDFLVPFYIVLCGVMVILLIIFIIYILNQEMSRTKYYNKKILFHSKYDKHDTMVKYQKRVLFRKKLYLYFLLLLVGIKEVFKKWLKYLDYKYYFL